MFTRPSMQQRVVIHRCSNRLTPLTDPTLVSTSPVHRLPAPRRSPCLRLTTAAYVPTLKATTRWCPRHKFTGRLLAPRRSLCPRLTTSAYVPILERYDTCFIHQNTSKRRGSKVELLHSNQPNQERVLIHRCSNRPTSHSSAALASDTPTVSPTNAPSTSPTAWLTYFYRRDHDNTPAIHFKIHRRKAIARMHTPTPVQNPYNTQANTFPMATTDNC